MTEAAERVTEFAFLALGWSQLCLTNAESNSASHRIKEKQGARIVDRRPARYVSGDNVEVTWLLTLEDWLARRTASARRGGREVLRSRPDALSPAPGSRPSELPLRVELLRWGRARKRNHWATRQVERGQALKVLRLPPDSLHRRGPWRGTPRHAPEKARHPAGARRSAAPR